MENSFEPPWMQLCDMMLYPILLIIFGFPKGFYTRIHHFQKCFNWELFCYGPIDVQWEQEVALTSNYSAKLQFFDVVINFAYHISISQGILH